MLNEVPPETGLLDGYFKDVKVYQEIDEAILKQLNLSQSLMYKKQNTVYSALRNICFNVLSWQGSGPQKNANKFYFRENCLEDVIHIVQDKDMYPDVRKLAIECLWMFGEKDDDRIHLIEKGTLPIVLQVMDDAELQESVWGILWGLAEYVGVHLKLIQEGIVQKLFYSLLESRVVDGSKVRIIGTLQLVSSTELCYEELHDIGMIHVLLKLDSPDMMIRYFQNLALANLLLFSSTNAYSKTISEENREKALSKIRKFLKSTMPANVRDIEASQLYTWVTMKPFVALLDCIYPEVFLLGLFSLANLTMKAENVEILDQAENLTDKVLAHYWCPLSQSRDYIATIFKNLKYEMPSLQSIIQHKLNSKYQMYEQQILERKNRKQQQREKELEAI